MLDLRVTHDRVDSSSDPTLNGHLRYPNNLDQSLNDGAPDKLRKYRADYNFHRETDSNRLIGKLTSFFQLQEFCQYNQIVDFFHYHHTLFSSMIKSRVGNILAKVADTSHFSQTSRLLTSSLSSSVPDPRPTQCL